MSSHYELRQRGGGVSASRSPRGRGQSHKILSARTAAAAAVTCRTHERLARSIPYNLGRRRLCTACNILSVAMFSSALAEATALYTPPPPPPSRSHSFASAAAVPRARLIYAPAVGYRLPMLGRRPSESVLSLPRPAPHGRFARTDSIVRYSCAAAFSVVTAVCTDVKSFQRNNSFRPSLIFAPRLSTARLCESDKR